MECKECCKEISKEVSDTYKGYCKSCYNEKFNSNDDTSDVNMHHRITLVYAVILFIVSIIAGCTIKTGYEDFNFIAMLIVLFVDFISSFLFYMLGTIIEELRQ